MSKALIGSLRIIKSTQQALRPISTISDKVSQKDISESTQESNNLQSKIQEDKSSAVTQNIRRNAARKAANIEAQENYVPKPVIARSFSTSARTQETFNGRMADPEISVCNQKWNLAKEWDLNERPDSSQKDSTVSKISYKSSDNGITRDSDALFSQENYSTPVTVHLPAGELWGNSDLDLPKTKVTNPTSQKITQNQSMER